MLKSDGVGFSTAAFCLLFKYFAVRLATSSSPSFDMFATLVLVGVLRFFDTNFWIPSLSSFNGETRMLTLLNTSDFESSVSDAVSLSVNLFRPLRRCDADDFVRAGDALRAGDRFLDERLDGDLLEARVVLVVSTTAAAAAAAAAPLLVRRSMFKCQLLSPVLRKNANFNYTITLRIDFKHKRFLG